MKAYKAPIKNLYYKTLDLTRLHLGGDGSGFISTSVQDMVFKTFLSNEKSYIIGKDFYEELSTIELKISPQYVPVNNQGIYIQLPYLVKLSKPKEYYGCAFCAVFDSAMRITNADGSLRKKTMIILIPLLNQNGTPTKEFFSCVLNLEFETVQESIDFYIKSSSTLDFPLSLLQVLLNLCVYIESGDPDIRHLLKPKSPTDRRNYEREFGYYYEQDVFHVGFNWKKAVMHNVSDTVRKSHYRWQPCGPARSMVRLKWINEHVMHFKNAKKKPEDV